MRAFLFIKLVVHVEDGNAGLHWPWPKRAAALLSILGGTADVNSPVDVRWAPAGPSGIKRVEISTDDDETWRQAIIVENQSLATRGRYGGTASRRRSRGKYVVRVRATDGDGVTQPPEEDRGAKEELGAQARMALKVRV